ncbi:MAG: hypothetical protein QNJ00_07915 [Woeseiaceae bacterium]|nr:hypothetical protein [Woeseiaceae bacterium]
MTFCACLQALLPLAGCGEPAPEVAESEAQPAGAGLLPAYVPNAGCGEDGRVVTTLYGALPGEIEWAAGEMNCEGMPRPGGAGARLRFAGEAAPGVEIAIIVAMPDLERGRVMSEVPSNVTVIEEGAGRFFSTTDLETCWTDVDEQSPLDDAGTHRVDGTLYCIGPLAEVNGTASVSIEELEFSGLLAWGSE